MKVSEYKEFIPYCVDSVVHKENTRDNHQYMEAELKVHANYEIMSDREYKL